MSKSKRALNLKLARACAVCTLLVSACDSNNSASQGGHQEGEDKGKPKLEIQITLVSKPPPRSMEDIQLVVELSNPSDRESIVLDSRLLSPTRLVMVYSSKEEGFIGRLGPFIGAFDNEVGVTLPPKESQTMTLSLADLLPRPVAELGQLRIHCFYNPGAVELFDAGIKKPIGYVFDQVSSNEIELP